MKKLRYKNGSYLIRRIAVVLLTILMLNASTGFMKQGQGKGYTISITIDEINISGLTVHLEGSAWGIDFPGPLDHYQVQVDWGDGHIDNDSRCSFTLKDRDKDGKVDDFEGYWISDPDHTYERSGNYTITAKLYHQNPPGAESGLAQIQVTIYVSEAKADVAIQKIGPRYAHVGETIIYIYNITNSGPDSATGVTVIDDKAGNAIYVSGDTNENGKLDVGENWIFTAQYNILITDPDPLNNRATVTSNISDPDESNNEARWTVDILNPLITVTKTGPNHAHENETITYTIVIKNIGDCPLYNVTVSDETLNFEEIINELPEGDVKTFEVEHKVPSPSGDIKNTVTAKGKDALGLEVSDNAAWTVDVLHPTLKVIKSANATMIHEGDWVRYNVTVVNTGDYDLNVTLSDEMLGINWNGTLKPGEKHEETADFQPTDDPTINIAIAMGTDELGKTVMDDDELAVDVLHPAIAIDKYADETLAHEGDIIHYTYIVTNVGDCPLYNVSVTDSLGIAVAYYDEFGDGDWVLEEGEWWRFMANYTVPTQTDKINNFGTAHGFDALGMEVTAIDSWTVDVLHPNIMVTKTANSTRAYAGDVIEYTIIVTNIGDCKLYNVNVTDSLHGNLLTNGVLDVGENINFTCTYTIKAGDPDPLVNTVTASGKDTLGLKVSDEAYAEVNVIMPDTYTLTVYVYRSGTNIGIQGVTVKINGVSYMTNSNGSVDVTVSPGNHTVETVSPFSPSSGTQYVFANWSDGLADNPRTILVTGQTTLTAYMKLQYYLMMSINPSGAGSISPASGWYDAGLNVQILAIPSSGYRFGSWTGSGSGSYSGTANSASITMNSPITEKANFVRVATVTFSASGLDSDASGAALMVDGVSYTCNQLPLMFTWDAGSSHSFAWLDPVSSTVHCKRYAWVLTSGLSTAKSGSITVPAEGGLVNATYKMQYYLTVISPYDTPSGEGWYDSGDKAYASLAAGIVNLTYGMRAVFTGWSRDASGTELVSNPIIMDAPKIAVANWVIQWLIDIEVTPEEVGSVPGEGWYNNCTTITFEAPEYIPSEEGTDGTRYRFDHWEVDGERFDGSIVSVHANASHTIIPIYVIQYRIIFNQTGLDQSANEAVVTVNGSEKKLEDLPFILWVDYGSSVSYTYRDAVSSIISGKQFKLENVMGPSSPVTAIGPANITGNYQTLYYLSVISEYGNPRGSGWYPFKSEARFGVTTPVDHGNRTLRVFLKWYGDANIFEPDGTILMTKPSVVIASWETQYLVTFNTTLPNKYVLRVPGVPETLPPSMDVFGMYYPVGEHITVGPAPIIVPGFEGVRYTLAGWTLDGTIFTYDVNMSFVVEKPHDVAVLYDTEYLLTVNAVGVNDPFAATITISSSASITHELTPTSSIQKWFKQGTDLALAVSTPNKIGHGYWAIFKEWTGHLQAVNRMIPLTMLSPRDLNAVFFKVNPVAESIPYSIVAGLISMLLCVVSARSRASNGKKRRSATSGIIVSTVALIVAAIVSITIARGYGININELLDFTNWAVIFLIFEAIVFALATAAVVKKVQRKKETPSRVS